MWPNHKYLGVTGHMPSVEQPQPSATAIDQDLTQRGRDTWTHHRASRGHCSSVIHTKVTSTTATKNHFKAPTKMVF